VAAVLAAGTPDPPTWAARWLLVVSIPVSQNAVFGAEACWLRAVTLLDGLDTRGVCGHRSPQPRHRSNG
jgi:hypothetical protein